LGIKRSVYQILALLIFMAIAARVVSAFSSPAVEPGVTNGRLPECPTTPNCVSSQAPADNQAFVEPLQTTDAVALSDLVALIDDLPRTRVITNDGTYSHIQFSSLVFGFIDDVELLSDKEKKQIHIRSASRIGYSDLGANRKRVERIRQLWTNR